MDITWRKWDEKQRWLNWTKKQMTAILNLTKNSCHDTFTPKYIYTILKVMNENQVSFSISWL